MYYVLEDEPELLILLCLPPKWWDCTCKSLHLVYVVLGTELRNSCMLGSTSRATSVAQSINFSTTALHNVKHGPRNTCLSPSILGVPRDGFRWSVFMASDFTLEHIVVDLAYCLYYVN